MKRVQVNNLLLAPASQLPFHDDWQRRANGLPAGSVLFVVPAEETPMKRSMRKIAFALHRQGRRVAALPAVKGTHGSGVRAAR